MPPIILRQAFLHAPNTFKPVSHIGAMNNTSSTVLNFKNVVYSMRSCPKTQALSLKVLYHYISVHCPKTQALSLKVFLTIIFPYIVPNPKLNLYKFFTIMFPYIVPKLKLYLLKFVPLYFGILSQNPSFLSQ